MCRERKGLGRADLAVKASVTSSYISLLERGQRDPSISTVKYISDALNVPISILLFLASDKKELESIDSELAEKLSLIALQLIEKT